MAKPRVVTVARGVAFFIGSAGFVAWLAGFIATDRWIWSQYLWWIPWLVYATMALPAALFAVLGPLRRNARRRVLSVVAFLLIVVVGLARDVRLGWSTGLATTSAITIVHWNASWPESRVAIEPARRILSRHPDVVVISNPYRFFGDGRDAAWRREGYDVVVVGVFAIASRVPLLEARQLAAGDEIAAASFVLDARLRLGRTVTLLAIDLPSSTGRPRFRVADACAKLLARHSASAPDVVLGDCNITRGSASLQLLAPGMRDAWDEAGVGWGASWPRTWPLLHLDHFMLAPSMRADRYEFFDPGSGVHRAQECRVGTRAPSN